MTFEKEFITAIQRLHFWQYGSNPTNFTSILYTLFQKADADNKRRLTRSFPFESMAYQEWMEAPTQDEFFHKYGLKSFSDFYDQTPPNKIEELKDDVEALTEKVQIYERQGARDRLEHSAKLEKENAELNAEILNLRRDCQSCAAYQEQIKVFKEAIEKIKQL